MSQTDCRFFLKLAKYLYYCKVKYCPVDIYLTAYVWNKEMPKEIWVVFPVGVIAITGTKNIKGSWANTERALRGQRMNRIIEDIHSIAKTQ